jgi:TM2 domain-containing membrane protein YozV
MSNQFPDQSAPRESNRWQQTAPQPFGQVPGPGATPAVYQQGAAAQYDTRHDLTAPRKTKATAILLCLPIIVGWLGIHNFYLGQTVRGVLHLVLIVLSLIPFVGMFFLACHAIYGLVEFVCIIAGVSDYGRDRQGRPLV